MTSLSELLKARAALLDRSKQTYTNGAREENAHLQPLLFALIEVACAADRWSTAASMFSEGHRVDLMKPWDDTHKALAKLREMVGAG